MYTEGSGGNYVSANEGYSYSSAIEDYSEYYFYSASADGEPADEVYISYRGYYYDSIGRVVNYEFGSLDEDSNSISTNDVEWSYSYEDGSSSELDSSTTTETYSYYNYETGTGSSYTSVTESEYSYSAGSSGFNDYLQRRDIEKQDQNDDGIIDYTTYSLYTNTDSGYTGVGAQYDSSDTLVYSDSFLFSQTTNSAGNTVFTNSYSVADDGDADGLINTFYEDTGIEEFDSEYNLVSQTYDSIYKNDYDGDGKADYVEKDKTTRTSTGGKLVEITWEDNGSDPATLTLGNSKDTDGDYNWDSTRNFSFAFGKPPSSWTNMGDHVTTAEDTLIG